MKYFSLLMATGALAMMTSCSSKMSHIIDDSDFEETVINRSDELSSRPEWVKESESYESIEGKIYSLGMTVINADQQIDAAYRIAENQAKISMSKNIEQKLEYFFQAAQEGMNIGDEASRFITTEVSKVNISGMHLNGRYWEKFVTIDSSGNKVSRYRVFVRVMMPESMLKEQISRAISGQKNHPEKSKEFINALNSKWNEIFVNKAEEGNKEPK